MRKSLWRQPTVHFLFLGGLLYAGQVWISGRQPAAQAPNVLPLVEFGTAQIEQIDRAWQRKTGRLPTPRGQRALLRQAIDEELLYREALALRLDEGNPSVHQRLVLNMRFLSNQPAIGETIDDENLLRQARELGLERSDPVIRQHMVGLMRNIARRSMAPEEMTEVQLEDYYQRHQDRFVRSARLRLSHVYLNADRRGSQLEADALRLLRRLKKESLDPHQAITLGDPFMLQNHLPWRSQPEVERTFGVHFAQAVMDLESGVWSGPISSSYGLHLVWVHELTPTVAAPLATVRRQVILGLEVERGEQRLAATLEELRARYDVRLEPTAIHLAQSLPPAVGSGS